MRIGQGRENAKKFIEENEDIRKELEDKIMANAQQLDYAASDEDEEGTATEETAAENSPSEEAPKKSKAKKSSVVVAADDDFEEFSIDEISE